MSRSTAQCLLPSTIATPPAEGKLTSLSQGDPSPVPALGPLGKDVLGRVGGEQRNSSFKPNLFPSVAMMRDPLGSQSPPVRSHLLLITFLKRVSGVQTMTLRDAGQGACPRRGPLSHL